MTTREELLQLMEKAGVNPKRGTGKKLLEAVDGGKSTRTGSVGHGAASEDRSPIPIM